MLIKKERFPSISGMISSLIPSSMKRSRYKRRGFKIGKNVKFGIGSYIQGKNVEIGDNTKIGMFTIIYADNLKLGKNVDIGAMCYINTPHVEIGNNSILREQVYVGGRTTPKSKLVIGENVKIFQFTVLNSTDNLIIGNNVGIGGRCLIFTHGSWQSIMDGYPVTFGRVVIKDNVWLPWQVIILPGVTIGEGSTIGAGSLITKDIPDYSLALGTPAKVVKQYPDYPPKLTQKEKKDLLHNIIKEFANYLNFSGLRSEINKINDEIKLSIHSQKLYIVYIFLSKIDYDKKCDCIISLNRINYNKIKRTHYYFDIENKLYYGEGDLVEELQNFFSRYGIRFRRN